MGGVARRLRGRRFVPVRGGWPSCAGGSARCSTARAGRALRILSLCAGDDRDVLPELAGTAPPVDVQAVLVELDPELAERARRAADGRDEVLRVRVGDAGDVSSFDDVLPVDLLLLCGVFGNVSGDDIRRTIATVPAMLVPGGTVIWTHGRFGDEQPTCARSCGGGSSRPVSTRSPSTASPSGSVSASPAGRSMRPRRSILVRACSRSSPAPGDPVTIGPSRRAKLSAGGRGMPTMLRTVAVVAYQGVLADESTAFVDVLSRLPGARLVVVGRRIGVVAGPGGAQWVEARFPEVDPDVVVVPGGLGSHRHAEIAEWIRHVRPRWVLSSSTGSAMLAAGGLLRGRSAATHWLAAPLLERHGVEATTDRLVVDGPFVTCAGLASTFEAADVVVRAVGATTLGPADPRGDTHRRAGGASPLPPSRTRYRPRTRRHAPPTGRRRRRGAVAVGAARPSRDVRVTARRRCASESPGRTARIRGCRRSRPLATSCRARDLADRHYAETLTVADMARAAHLSPAHFSREFRRTFGESPHQYLLTRRLERAAALLRTTDWTVARICLAVGIQSQPTFTTSFRTHFGPTPTEYRAAFKPAAALAVVPMCVTRVYGRPRYRTIREDGDGADQYVRPRSENSPRSDPQEKP